MFAEFARNLDKAHLASGCTMEKRDECLGDANETEEVRVKGGLDVSEGLLKWACALSHATDRGVVHNSVKATLGLLNNVLCGGNGLGGCNIKLDELDIETVGFELGLHVQPSLDVARRKVDGVAFLCQASHYL